MTTNNARTHALDPWLSTVQRMAYTTEEKDALLARTLRASSSVDITEKEES